MKSKRYVGYIRLADGKTMNDMGEVVSTGKPKDMVVAVGSLEHCDKVVKKRLEKYKEGEFLTYGVVDQHREGSLLVKVGENEE